MFCRWRGKADNYIPEKGVVRTSSQRWAADFRFMLKPEDRFLIAYFFKEIFFYSKCLRWYGGNVAIEIQIAKNIVAYFL